MCVRPPAGVGSMKELNAGIKKKNSKYRHEKMFHKLVKKSLYCDNNNAITLLCYGNTIT